MENVFWLPFVGVALISSPVCIGLMYLVSWTAYKAFKALEKLYIFSYATYLHASKKCRIW